MYRKEPHMYSFRTKEILNTWKDDTISPNYIIKDGVKLATDINILDHVDVNNVYILEGKILSRTFLTTKHDVCGLIHEYIKQYSYSDKKLNDEELTNYCIEKTGNKSLEIHISKITKCFETVYKDKLYRSNEVYFENNVDLTTTTANNL